MKLDIPARAFAAYIFDCDGTIADTMPIHYRAWSMALAERGAYFPEDIFYAWGGTPTAVIVEKLNAKYGFTLPVDETVHRKERLYMENVKDTQPIMPVLEIAREMHGMKPLAIASGGHREMVEATLRAIGIFDLFNTIVCAEDYKLGKPNPEPFLLAASRLGVDPKDCLVFEDTPTGIAAAEAAGMHHVLVPSAPTPPIPGRPA